MPGEILYVFEEKGFRWTTEAYYYPGSAQAVREFHQAR